MVHDSQCVTAGFLKKKLAISFLILRILLETGEVVDRGGDLLSNVSSLVGLISRNSLNTVCRPNLLSRELLMRAIFCISDLGILIQYFFGIHLSFKFPLAVSVSREHRGLSTVKPRRKDSSTQLTQSQSHEVPS